MFLIKEDKAIYATRGDIVFFNVTATVDGQPYTFKEGDIVRILVYEKKACNCVALIKDFAVDRDAETVEVFLHEVDTKIGGIISKPVDYWYEVVLNPDTNPQTIIGYDENGAKVFKLFPEGKELTEDDDVIYDEAKLNVKDAIEKAVEDEFEETPIQEMVDDYFERNPVGCEVFVAEYGVTTYEELEEAYNAGKAMVLLVDGQQIPFNKRDGGSYSFSINRHRLHYNYWCRSDDSWGQKTDDLPTAHASRHAQGGTDPISPTSIGAAEKNHASRHAKDGDDAIAPADIGAAVNKDWILSVTHADANGKSLWYSYAGGYQKSIYVGGILSTDKPIVDVALANDNNSNKIWLDAWSKVSKVSTADNYIYLRADNEAPAVNFNINVKVVR